MRIWCFRNCNYFSENAGAPKSMEIFSLLYVPMKYGIIDVIITLKLVEYPEDNNAASFVNSQKPVTIKSRSVFHLRFNSCQTKNCLIDRVPVYLKLSNSPS